METISGSVNKAPLKGYSIEGEQIELPDGINDFYVTIIDELGYVETRQKWSYDSETGCLYFIEEVE